MKKVFSLILGLGLVSVIFNACEKDTPAPTVEIFATIDGYSVTFNPTVTDVNTYSWDFGDGSELSTESNPVHTYDVSGTYNVTLNVTGDGGEATATKEIVINASIEEMLTGGPTALNGKTWILSTEYSPAVNGGGPVLNEMPIDMPSFENVLCIFENSDLCAEYDNEFTFYSDGTYEMNLKNGNSLAGAVYGAVLQSMVGDPVYDIGMCAASYTPPVSSTWALHTDNFVVDAITDPMEEDVPPVHGDVTFTGKNWVQLSEGAFFGILDFPVSQKFIIKSLTADKMQAVLFLCGYGYGDNVNDMMLPTNLIHVTFVPKSK
ncbi:MAG: PKD domain-containing protein [Bacteroidales bacterium]